MKKIIALIVVFVMMSVVPASFAAEYDISVFENDPAFKVEFDEMDDTGTIELTDACIFLGAGEDDKGGALLGDIDIRVLPDYPPLIRLTFYYMGEKWCFIEKFIVKPAETRYTYEVKRDTDISDGKIYEQFTIALTSKTIGLLEDMLRSDVVMVKYRLDGDRDVDGNLIISSKESLQKLYDAYIASGALNNDFTAVDLFMPCTIK